MCTLEEQSVEVLGRKPRKGFTRKREDGPLKNEQVFNRTSFWEVQTFLLKGKGVFKRLAPL